jgi:hypothetical protein
MNVLIEVIGWAGTILLVGAYALLTLSKIKSTSWQYQTMNAAGALFLVVNTISHTAWPAASLNTIWFIIGVVGLIAIIRSSKRPSNEFAS